MRPSSLIVLFVAVTAFLASASAMEFSPQLWNKYRVNLLKIVEPRYGSKAYGLPQAHTRFHVLTSPEEARWTSTKEDLQEFFASHPVDWSSTFDYIDRTASNTIAELYKKGLAQCRAAPYFLAFSRAKKDTFSGRVSYPWNEIGEKLSTFTANAASGRSPKVHFVVQESAGSTTVHTPWGVHSYMDGESGPFIKQISNTNVNKYRKLGDENMSVKPMASTTWRRRRRRSAPPPQATIFIKSQKFHMDFKAGGLTGITVAPGNWFDRKFINKYKGNACLSGLVSPHKPLSLIPRIAWVAYRPNIKLTLSETEYKKVRSIWSLGSTLGLSVAGNFFRHSRYRRAVMADSESWNALSNAQRQLYSDESKVEMHSDKVIFNIETREKTLSDSTFKDEVSFSVKSDLVPVATPNVNAEQGSPSDGASFEEHTREVVGHADESAFVATNSETEIEPQTMTSTTWRRRRRRRRYVPPPPPKKIYEKVHTITFVSNSPFAEVIAVTTERLDMM